MQLNEAHTRSAALPGCKQEVSLMLCRWRVWEMEPISPWQAGRKEDRQPASPQEGGGPWVVLAGGRGLHRMGDHQVIFGLQGRVGG